MSKSTPTAAPDLDIPAIASKLVDRLDQLYPRRGAKRDAAALELAVGALAALNVTTPDTPKRTAWELVAFLVSVRGADALADCAKRGAKAGEAA